MDTTLPATMAASDKTPRTERGRRTLRKLLDAAAVEFGQKGFHEASITGITSRAGTALGTFYTYFNSKDELFRALVTDMSNQIRQIPFATTSPAMSALEAERTAFAAFLQFARDHKEIYRIIDEAEFVAPENYRNHYESGASRIFQRLRKGAENGEYRTDLEEAHAWAIMGMNFFLGLKYSIWSDDTPIEHIADIASSLLQSGIARVKR